MLLQEHSHPIQESVWEGTVTGVSGISDIEQGINEITLGLFGLTTVVADVS